MKVHTHTTQNRQQMANANGDDATTPQQAASKVQMLWERVKAGVSFHDLAVAYSEDPQSAPRGGDLDLVPVSRLKQTPPALRDAVLNKPPAVRESGESGRRVHSGPGRLTPTGRTTGPHDAGGAHRDHRHP